MSIIEQAAQRLEELKRVGMSVPTVQDGIFAGEAPSAPAPSDGEASAPSPAGATRSRARPAIESSRCVDIDLSLLASRNIVTPDSPRSQVADEFRVIKRPLLERALGKGKDTPPAEKGNLIMVTSALPGEGKSFTSINLAMNIAMEMGNTVLLVDADVSKPTLLKTLGMPDSKGLMDVLLDENLDLGEVLLRTNVEKLAVLPAGSKHKHATEMLASESMSRLIDEIASRYSDRIVIFDSPPLLVTTESRVLATHMGQIVMVVAASETPQAAVKQALATIESCPSVSLMLNKASGMKGADYGIYGYGSGYGYGYGD